MGCSLSKTDKVDEQQHAASTNEFNPLLLDAIQEKEPSVAPSLESQGLVRLVNLGGSSVQPGTPQNASLEPNASFVPFVRNRTTPRNQHQTSPSATSHRIADDTWNVSQTPSGEAASYTSHRGQRLTPRSTSPQRGEASLTRDPRLDPLASLSRDPRLDAQSSSGTRDPRETTPTNRSALMQAFPVTLPPRNMSPAHGSGARLVPNEALEVALAGGDAKASVPSYVIRPARNRLPASSSPSSSPREAALL